MKLISFYIHNYIWIKTLRSDNGFKVKFAYLVEKALIPEILKQEGEEYLVKNITQCQKYGTTK